MASEASDEPRPVLTYASTAPERAGGAQWVHGADGVRLVVPPPAAWRRMAGPAVRLVVTTPFVLAFVGALAGAVVQTVRRQDVTYLAGAACGLLMGLAATGIWAGALTRLVRIARRGRQPFVLRLLDTTFEITPAADDPLDPGAWPISSVHDVRLDVMSWSLFVRPVRLQIVFHDGEGMVTLIPWPDASALLPVETELRRALGVDLPGRARPAREPYDA